MKDLDIPVLRWPGGNYASGYHWKLGAGPKNERIARKNPVWMKKFPKIIKIYN